MKRKKRLHHLVGNLVRYDSVAHLKTSSYIFITSCRSTLLLYTHIHTHIHIQYANWFLCVKKKITPCCVFTVYLEILQTLSHFSNSVTLLFNVLQTPHFFQFCSESKQLYKHVHQIEQIKLEHSQKVHVLKCVNKTNDGMILLLKRIFIRSDECKGTAYERTIRSGQTDRGEMHA